MEEPAPKGLWTHSANDRLKAQWSNCLAWSTVMAAAVHAAAFAFWPAWEMSRQLLSEPPIELVQIGWAPEDTGPNPGDGPSTAAPVVDESAADPVVADLQDRIDRVDAEIATQAELLRERLRRRASPIPTIAESEPEPEPGPGNESLPGAPEEGSMAVRGYASTAELPASLSESALDLDRLANVRPELALVAPALWVLVRNSPEVASYMRRVYTERRVDPRATGTVRVALWIDERGSVEWAEISESSGRPELDEVALALFNEVVDFRPARNEGIPVPTSAIFSITFPWF